MVEALPGDVILVQIRGSWLTRAAGWAIRAGAALTRQPTTWTHVIVAHHVDDAGTLWGAQGQPGVVGWEDLRPWLADPHTITNVGQPKTAEQRAAVCSALTPLVGRAGYDWAAIAADAAIAVEAAEYVAPLWLHWSGPQWSGRVPGHVICSSLADYAYERAGLVSPRADRWCTPADWAQLITARGWEVAASGELGHPNP